LTFDEQLPFVESHQVSIRKAFDHANINKCHISQSHFITSGTHSPDLPIELPLYAAPCRLAIGAVICPFTASDEGHSKLWWPERWVAVIDHLVKHRFIGTVYVIGGDADDFEPYRHPNAVPVRNMPLPRVLDLLRQAPVFASADSGPSHLAHFGGVSRHVLMLPGHVAAEVNQNPRGRIIHARASNVTAERMIGEIDRVLAR
jgi:ADP-heptose:LPS heptosyltransferase